MNYLDFVSGHLASAETEWPKHIQVTKLIQVASMYSVFFQKDFFWQKRNAHEKMEKTISMKEQNKHHPLDNMVTVRP